MTTRTCIKCNHEQPITEFRRNGRVCYECKRKQKLMHSRNYRLTHLEQVREKDNEYRKTIKGMFSTMKSKAKVRGIFCNISLKEFADWYDQQEKVCAYCKIPQELLVKIGWHKVNSDGRRDKYGRKSRKGTCGGHKLTIDRKDSTRGYEIDNIVLCCFPCNSMKSHMISYQTMMAIAEQYITKEWKAKLCQT